MPIIIDTNCFSKVFKDEDYIQLKRWIIDGPGMIVYGGTKFYNELKVPSCAILPLLKEFNRIGKTIKANTELVDSEQKRIESIEKDTDFDDPHLVALSKITKTLIIATEDKRAIRFLTKIDFYGTSKLTPKIYSKKKYKTILTKENIHPSNLIKCKILNKSEKPAI